MFEIVKEKAVVVIGVPLKMFLIDNFPVPSVFSTASTLEKSKPEVEVHV